jgi:F-type H+-transporting ATPase subunit epsilon
MKELFVEVITPSKQAFSGQAKSVTIPGTAGSFQVLFNHAPILSSFELGVVKIVDTNSKTMVFATGGGTVEVLNNKVLLLAESFESPDEIDVERAKAAMQRAKERLAKKREEKIDVARAEAALKRAINRLKLSGNLN